MGATSGAAAGPCAQSVFSSGHLSTSHGAGLQEIPKSSIQAPGLCQTEGPSQIFPSAAQHRRWPCWWPRPQGAPAGASLRTGPTGSWHSGFLLESTWRTDGDRSPRREPHLPRAANTALALRHATIPERNSRQETAT